MPRRSSLVVCGGIVVVVFCVGSVDAAARGGGDENRIKGSRRNSVQPPPPRQLSLVEVEETSYESHNLPQHDRKTGGLLRVFDQVVRFSKDEEDLRVRMFLNYARK